MIGLPGETRENVFETIKLNKELGVHAINVYIIYPYPGTEISDKYKLNFRDGENQVIPVSKASSFQLSQMSISEVEALLKTFELYVILSEKSWPRIEKVEKGLEGSEDILGELEQECAELLRGYNN